jgi:hypothetical protein
VDQSITSRSSAAKPADTRTDTNELGNSRNLMDGNDR